MLNCIDVDSETNRLNFAITANCIVVGNEINHLNFATVLNETGKLDSTSQILAAWASRKYQRIVSFLSHL